MQTFQSDSGDGPGQPCRSLHQPLHGDKRLVGLNIDRFSDSFLIAYLATNTRIENPDVLPWFTVPDFNGLKKYIIINQCHDDFSEILIHTTQMILYCPYNLFSFIIEDCYYIFIP